jgi:hypothetical protein
MVNKPRDRPGKGVKKGSLKDDEGEDRSICGVIFLGLIFPVVDL